LKISIVICVIILAILTLVSSGMAWAHWNEQYIDAKVIDKYVDISRFYCKYGSDCATKSHYYIYTDKGTFEAGIPSIDRTFNENIFGMDTGKAKIIYDSIEKEKTYKFHAYGYRIDILNVYPVVTDIKEE
jgi:hypothetical protein